MSGRNSHNKLILPLSEQVLDGTSKRFDCPNCGGKNTLSITKSLGKVKWYCFKASCSTRGIQSSTRTVEDIRSRLTSSYEAGSSPVLVDTFVPISSRVAAINYLSQFAGCLKAVNNDWVNVRYDVRLDRIVFLLEQEGTFVDGTGRKIPPLNGQHKWHRYGATGQGILIQQPNADTSKVIVVEDCISACVVSNILPSYALLGTKMTDHQLLDLKGFDEVVIALDPDAKKVSIKLASMLGMYTKCRSVFLDGDPKYQSKRTLSSIL